MSVLERARTVLQARRDDHLARLVAHLRLPLIRAHNLRRRTTAEDIAAKMRIIGVAPLEAALMRGRGERPLLVPATGGSLPYCAFTDILQLLVFVLPYANADDANYVPDENLEVERCSDGIRPGAAVLDEIGRIRGSRRGHRLHRDPLIRPCEGAHATHHTG